MRMRMEVQEVGAMNSNDSHDILPIASSITRFKKIVQTMREDLIISGGVQQTNTNSNDDDDLDVTPSDDDDRDSDQDEDVGAAIRCRRFAEELIISGRVQQIISNNDDLDDPFPPSDEDEDVGPTRRCPDCTRVSKMHFLGYCLQSML